MNPKITELKPYKGFNIIKEQTFSNWGSHVAYFAYKEVEGGVKEYIDDCNDLAKLKEKIRLRCYDE
jgi:hypothetical protein